jgi:hypothetical protein
MLPMVREATKRVVFTRPGKTYVPTSSVRRRSRAAGPKDMIGIEEKPESIIPFPGVSLVAGVRYQPTPDEAAVSPPIFRMTLLQAYEDRRCNRALCSRRAQQETESYSLHSAHQRPVQHLVQHE